jgi:deoxyribodipyrimidine photo-lyase
MKLVVWWLKRVLRLEDNPVLQKAISFGFPVLPLYIYDPEILRPETFRGRFLLQAVAGLEEELSSAGYTLMTAYGNPNQVFQELVQKIEIYQVVTEKDITPFAKKELGKLEAIIPIYQVNGITLHEAEDVHKPDGSAYQKYSSYRNRWLDLPVPEMIPGIKEMPILAKTPCSLSIPEKPPISETILPYPPQQAKQALRDYLHQSSWNYGVLRNRVDLDETSHCSHLFRFGLLSPGQALSEVNKLIAAEPMQAEKSGAEIWRDELIWREFFNHLMQSYATDQDRLKNRDGSEIAWLQDAKGLLAWQQGRTGYPLVDAAMRQLVQTGRMPGRARMVVASFLAKDLFIWWHLGEKFFMEHLLDGDPAANHGNWQWVAGIGTDAAPFFRIFNPVTQSKKFDPQGDYIRTWLPELRQVPGAFLHEPWTMNQQDQSFYRCRMEKDYPGPIVDHAAARFRALELFRTRKKI